MSYCQSCADYQKEIDRLRAGQEQQLMLHKAECAGLEATVRDFATVRQERDALRSLLTVAESALEEGMTAISNMATSGHESHLLKKHPSPCNYLDFCVVKDAMRRFTKLQDALDKLRQGGKSE